MARRVAPPQVGAARTPAGAEAGSPPAELPRGLVWWRHPRRWACRSVVVPWWTAAAARPQCPRAPCYPEESSELLACTSALVLVLEVVLVLKQVLVLEQALVLERLAVAGASCSAFVAAPTHARMGIQPAVVSRQDRTTVSYAAWAECRRRARLGAVAWVAVWVVAWGVAWLLAWGVAWVGPARACPVVQIAADHGSAGWARARGHARG